MKNVEIYKLSELLDIKKLDKDLHKMPFFGVIYVVNFETHIKVGCTDQPHKAITDALRNGKEKVCQFAISKHATNYVSLRLQITRRFKEQRIGKSLSYVVSFDEILSYMESLEYKDESAQLEQDSKNIATFTKTLVLKGARDLSSIKQETPISVVNKSSLLGEEIDIYRSAEFPLFRASDVAKWIEHSDVSMMLKNIDEEEKLTQAILVSGQRRNVWFLTEEGMYEVLMLSRTDRAKQFKKGVKAILHEIRTKGGYIATQQNDTPEMIMARALKVADETIKRNEERMKALETQNQMQGEQIELQKKEIAVSAPKAKYYDDTLASQDCITSTQVADDLGISAKALNQKLAAAKIIYFQSDQWHLCIPYKSWNLHGTRTHNYFKRDGSVGTKVNLVWNQRGKRFILALFNNGFNVKAAIAESFTNN